MERTNNLTAEQGRAPELIVITGPTAVGKTAVAVELARALETEIISADSMQVYKHLSIGTAKPDREELKGIPYHLIDFVKPEYQYNAGDFVADADRVIQRLLGEGKIPIVAGGTGMYIRALIQGIFEESSRDQRVRNELDARADQCGLYELYAELQRVDPAAKHISAGDRQRIIRALEVYLVTGRPISSFHTHTGQPPRYRAKIFVLTLSRELLYERINRRVDAMLDHGLLDEVRYYIGLGFSPDNPAINALGYAELIRHLRGEMPLEEAVEEMKKKTRNFAKRQMTWFRSMKNAEFILADGKQFAELSEEIEKRLEIYPRAKDKANRF